MMLDGGVMLDFYLSQTDGSTTNDVQYTNENVGQSSRWLYFVFIILII